MNNRVATPGAGKRRGAENGGWGTLRRGGGAPPRRVVGALRMAGIAGRGKRGGDFEYPKPPRPQGRVLSSRRGPPPSRRRVPQPPFSAPRLFPAPGVATLLFIARMQL